MGDMEWALLNSRKREHDAIVTAISDLDRMGCLVSGVCFKDGDLEVICYPPGKEDGSEKKLQEALEAGYGTDETPTVQAISNALIEKDYALLSLDRLWPLEAEKFVLTIQRTDRVPTARRSDILGQHPLALQDVSDCPA
jgi:hypothetical protein